MKKWDIKKIQELYDMPILDLVYKAASIHRKNFDSNKVQLCTLLSVKTGNCPEDCSYCAQSSRYKAPIEVEKLKSIAEVLEKAQIAKDNGSSRFCMGAAWKNLINNEDFEHVLEMIRAVKKLGLQVCCSMGMLNKEQAVKLKEAGLYAYNHNLDTSREYYKEVITTRTYDDRLNTIRIINDTGISVCCGCILGLGETEQDRINFIHELLQLKSPPESIPINVLVPIENTPLENNPQVHIWDVVRMVALVRITMPTSVIRLSAGRIMYSEVEQSMLFMAGANSFFVGDKLLTTRNNEESEDIQMLKNLGLESSVF